MKDPIVKIEIVNYDPRWPDLYAEERERVEAVLGDLAESIEHIGVSREQLYSAYFPHQSSSSKGQTKNLEDAINYLKAAGLILVDGDSMVPQILKQIAQKVRQERQQRPILLIDDLVQSIIFLQLICSITSSRWKKDVGISSLVLRQTHWKLHKGVRNSLTVLHSSIRSMTV